MHINKNVALPAFFVLLAGLPVVVLGWMGWRLLDQDQTLERNRLDGSAALVATELNRSLIRWEDLLGADGAGPGGEPPSGTAWLAFDARGVSDQRGAPLAFFPAVAPAADIAPAVFAAADAQELLEKALPEAEVSYRALAATRDRRVRGEALVRLARCLRKQGRTAEALSVYGDLAAMGDTVVAGDPAELLARNERAALFETLGDPRGRDRETAALTTLLWDGRLRIDRATFDFYASSAPAPTPPAARSATALADAVYAFWPAWQRQSEGRDSVVTDAGAFVSVWRRTSSGTAGLVGPIETLMAPAAPTLAALQVEVGLDDSSGHLAWGAASGRADAVVKASRETGLPWKLRVAIANPAAALDASRKSRSLLVAAFALMVLVIAVASYTVFRSVNRELAVARLQSDFVATVSHEFRTPLAAMRHLTDLLEEGGTPADRLSQYYRALGKETRRLHAMVEGLLDFGRMESGRRVYQIAATDASVFVREVVDEFCDQPASAGRRIDVQTPDSGLRIRADRDALALALRNLLDNAVKYSPESSTIAVSVEQNAAHVNIAVQDEGPGISKDEQRAIFRKFVRGSAASDLNVQGTGIGLTMAERVVVAHRGRLELASEPGRGSRFTIVLPGESS